MLVGDAFLEVFVLARIIGCYRCTKNGDCSAACLNGGEMGDGVDALCESGYDRVVGFHELAREFRSASPSLVRGFACPYDSNAPTAGDIPITLKVEQLY